MSDHFKAHIAGMGSILRWEADGTLKLHLVVEGRTLADIYIPAWVPVDRRWGPNDTGPPKGPDGLEDVEGVQGGERQIDSHEPS